MHNAILRADRVIVRSFGINRLLGIAAFAGGLALLLVQ